MALRPNFMEPGHTGTNSKVLIRLIIFLGLQSGAKLFFRQAIVEL